MQIKKITSLVLAAALSISLAACGNSQTTAVTSGQDKQQAESTQTADSSEAKDPESAQAENKKEDQQAETAAENGSSAGNNILILYFSADNTKDVDAVSSATPMTDGTTSVEWIANIIHGNVGGDLIPIIPSEDYPLEYEALADYAKKERDDGGRPAFEDLAETFLIDKGERLGRFIGRFREAYFKAAGMNPYTGVVYNYVPLPGAEEAIYSRISDITVSMKALDYLDMPEQVMVNHYVDMEPDERELYDAMKKELLVEIGDETIDAANAAVLSGKLLQMANGAIYNTDRQMRVIHDQKLQELADLIEQANGQNVLVAYWYQHDHERIREYLTDQGYKPRDMKSDQDIVDWNAGKIQVGLISPASAGHGLNIQKGGHILIWFSLVWSLEMYQQTNARLWRQGQKEVVTIHHIVCRDTVDEDVLAALKHKDTTQQNLIAAVKAHMTI